MVEHARYPWLDLLRRDDFGDPPPNLTCALEVTPDGWRVAVVPCDVPAEVFEDVHRVEGVFLVGGELALEVSDPSEVPWFVGKLIILLVKEVKLICVTAAKFVDTW